METSQAGRSGSLEAYVGRDVAVAVDLDGRLVPLSVTVKFITFGGRLVGTVADKARKTRRGVRPPFAFGDPVTFDVSDVKGH